MKKYYLKTQNPCNLYSIKVEMVTHNRELDDSKYIVFEETQIDTFKNLVSEFKKCMDDFWQEKGGDKNGGFEENKEYYYVTTSYSSHLNRLKVIKNLIKKESDALDTSKHNYFKKESDAKELCERLKNILYYVQTIPNHPQAHQARQRDSAHARDGSDSDNTAAHADTILQRGERGAGGLYAYVQLRLQESVLLGSRLRFQEVGLRNAAQRYGQHERVNI